MRVVLTFDGSNTCSNIGTWGAESCSASVLDADLDLEVWETVNGQPQLKAYSATAASSYEFVEFTAEANHTYDIKIKAYHWWGSSTYFGLSWYGWPFSQSTGS